MLKKQKSGGKFQIEWQYNMESQLKQLMHQQTSQEQTEEQLLKSDHVELPLKLCQN